MTDYEVAYLFLETVNTMNGLTQSFVGTLFAFLIASALAAQRLSRNLSRIALALFGVTQIMMIFQVWNASRSFANLALEIKTRSIAPAGDLTWHAVHNAPSWTI